MVVIALFVILLLGVLWGRRRRNTQTMGKRGIMEQQAMDRRRASQNPAFIAGAGDTQPAPGSLVDMAKDIKDALGLGSSVVAVRDICAAARAELGLSSDRIIDDLPLPQQVQLCWRTVFATVDAANTAGDDNNDGYLHVAVTSRRASATAELHRNTDGGASVAVEEGYYSVVPETISRSHQNEGALPPVPVPVARSGYQKLQQTYGAPAGPVQTAYSRRGEGILSPVPSTPAGGYDTSLTQSTVDHYEVSAENTVLASTSTFEMSASKFYEAAGDELVFTTSGFYQEYTPPVEGADFDYVKSVASVKAGVLDRMRIDPRRVKLGKLLGSGQYGQVFAGTLAGVSDPTTVTQVAVKTVKTAEGNEHEAAAEAVAASDDLATEAALTGSFDHPNVVCAFGVFGTGAQDPWHLVLEHCEHGALDSFLTEARIGGQDVLSFGVHRLLVYTGGVAAGMVYMSGLGFVHRDLAARNVLVDGNDTAKIADFGLSREQTYGAYNAVTARPLPLKWMSVEAIEYVRFTAASDVWSFGVLVWEVLMLAEKPYSDIPNVELVTALKVEGRRLPAPAGCPAAVYDLLLECWCLDPTTRPTFPQIEARLHTAYMVIATPCNTVKVDPSNVIAGKGSAQGKPVGVVPTNTNGSAPVYTAGSPTYMGWRTCPGPSTVDITTVCDYRGEQQAGQGVTYAVPHELGAATGSVRSQQTASPGDAIYAVAPVLFDGNDTDYAAHSVALAASATAAAFELDYGFSPAPATDAAPDELGVASGSPARLFPVLNLDTTSLEAANA